MEATDLMLNDFVKHDNKICRVRSIEGVMILLSFEGGEKLTAEDNIEPIPLTKEILEKNGIKLLEVGDNGVATPARDRNRFEKWEIHTQRKDTYLWYDRLCKYWHLHNMDGARLHFVHDLQHALKLCEIDKTIEL